jgi:hypothetical protein
MTTQRRARLFELAEAADPRRFGGKAAGLAWLLANGFPVPKGVCLEAQTPEEHFGRFALPEFQDSFVDALTRYFGPEPFFVIARSSATIEDSPAESFAGRFASAVGPFKASDLIGAVQKVAASASNADLPKDIQIGVIIQKLAQASAGGVLFSSDPVSGVRRRVLVSYVEGFAGRLLEGSEPGCTLEFDAATGELIKGTPTEPPSMTTLQALCKLGKEIEAAQSAAIDLEWVVDRGGRLWVVQCRPIVYPLSGLVEVAHANLASLPPIVRSSSKVRLRLDAEAAGIAISPASVATVRAGGLEPFGDWPEPGEQNSGYSVVLLHPARLEGTVQRSFVGDVTDLKCIVDRCHRYAVREYPRFSSLEDSLRSVLTKALDETWYASAIVQEIFHAQYTGIAQRFENGYMLEIGRGHFIPKGLVEASRYVLDEAKNLSEAIEVVQQRVFDIIDGAVVVGDECDEEVRLPAELLTRIARVFEPLLRDGSAVEFGITYPLSQEGDRRIYLIDLVEGGEQKTLDAVGELAGEGVLSVGRASGRVCRLDQDVEASLHAHFHDLKESNEAGRITSTIFVAETPHIGLAPLLAQIDPHTCAFVFARGSLLCHLAVLLRENGVPAVCIGNVAWLHDGSHLRVDGQTSGRAPEERAKQDE